MAIFTLVLISSCTLLLLQFFDSVVTKEERKEEAARKRDRIKDFTTDMDDISMCIHAPIHFTTTVKCSLLFLCSTVHSFATLTHHETRTDAQFQLYTVGQCDMSQELCF